MANTVGDATQASLEGALASQSVVAAIARSQADSCQRQLAQLHSSHRLLPVQLNTTKTYALISRALTLLIVTTRHGQAQPPSRSGLMA